MSHTPRRRDSPRRGGVRRRAAGLLRRPALRLRDRPILLIYFLIYNFLFQMLFFCFTDEDVCSYLVDEEVWSYLLDEEVSRYLLDEEIIFQMKDISQMIRNQKTIKLVFETSTSTLLHLTEMSKNTIRINFLFQIHMQEIKNKNTIEEIRDASFVKELCVVEF